MFGKNKNAGNASKRSAQSNNSKSNKNMECGSESRNSSGKSSSKSEN
ncbi:MAG: hypothetical protein RR400_03465 [Clostridia bacterium]